MNSITYIEKTLNRMAELTVLEKFDFILSSAKVLNGKEEKNRELILELLSRIEVLRYEMAYTKSIEAISSRLDKVLAYEAWDLAKKVLAGKDLKKYIEGVLYYEINEGYKEELIEELNGLN